MLMGWYFIFFNIMVLFNVFIINIVLCFFKKDIYYFIMDFEV